MRISYLGCIALLSVVVLQSCGGSKKTKTKNLQPGTWQATPVLIDGDSKDWPSPYPNYDSKSKIAYATSNDGKFLYITMETGDELTEMKIAKAGMIVSIDTGGGKDAGFNINFPLQNDNADIEVPQHEKGGGDASTRLGKQLSKSINKAIDQAGQFSLDGFPGCNGGYVVSQVTPCGIKVRARIDEYKELVWEAAIPIKALYNKDQLSAADAGRPISVCFQVKALKAPKSKEGDNGGGAMNSGMGSNSSMGGRGGGRGGQGGAPRTKQAENPMAHLYLATKTWKHFTLVYQQ